MAQQNIDTTTNHGNYIGDPAVTAFGKVNANFTEVYAATAAAMPKTGGAFTGPVTFSARPTFNGLTPYDTGNLLPSTYVARGVVNTTTGTEFASGNPPNIASISASNNDRNTSLLISNNTNNSASAVQSFIREGIFGMHFGLDTDNTLKCGGWSMGAIGYGIFTAGVNLIPSNDNVRSLGNASLRFTQLYATTATINTSDERYKTDITDTTLGLDFIMSLRPVSYKLIESEKTSEQVKTGDVESMVAKVDDNGIPVVDDKGEPVLVGTGVFTPLYEEQFTSVPGTRNHQGLISQEVVTALTAAGITPAQCAIWTQDDATDPNSRQGLRYEEFVAPLIKALQEQNALIVALTARVAVLEAAKAAPAA